MNESDPKDKAARTPTGAQGDVQGDVQGDAGRDVHGDAGRDARSGTPGGGVQHDSRGNAVWQWAAESGRHLIDSTSRLLKRLDVPGLSVEGDEPEEEKKQKELQLAGEKKASGYNPYETTRPRAAAPTPAKPAPPKSAPPAVQPPPKSWLGKVFKKD